MEILQSNYGAPLLNMELHNYGVYSPMSLHTTKLNKKELFLAKVSHQDLPTCICEIIIQLKIIAQRHIAILFKSSVQFGHVMHSFFRSQWDQRWNLEWLPLFKVRFTPLKQWRKMLHVDGLVQDCSNSSALAMELLHSCTKPLIWYPGDQGSKYLIPLLNGTGASKTSNWASGFKPMLFFFYIKEMHNFENQASEW